MRWVVRLMTAATPQKVLFTTTVVFGDGAPSIHGTPPTSSPTHPHRQPAPTPRSPRPAPLPISVCLPGNLLGCELHLHPHPTPLILPNPSALGRASPAGPHSPVEARYTETPGMGVGLAGMGWGLATAK